ncbi:type II toxin-antitoxin system ParD family antitoxin [Paremcibacter congregatus]|uniref:ribbon-helix-helix domain-containing protein n=1 Tax=Paremcibacter congregatus TaxID=2043170 RepID=UPI0030EE5596|tara:strand:+ start:521 stop:790 length:270 start_codon:yes stop_codon:yes gene_type:complete
MTVKSSISLTDSQDAFARTLVAQGRYPSVSAVFQQGLELLRLKTEGEELEVAALRKLLGARREGKFVESAAMKDRIATIANKKRRAHGL